MQDSGKLNDDVAVSLVVTDREGRSHMYGFRRTMRFYQGELAVTGDGWSRHTVEFYCHESEKLIELTNTGRTLGLKLVETLTQHNPRIMQADEPAMAQAAVALSDVCGSVLAGVLLQHGEETLYDTIARLGVRIRDSAEETAKITRKQREQAQRT